MRGLESSNLKGEVVPNWPAEPRGALRLGSRCCMEWPLGAAGPGLRPVADAFAAATAAAAAALALPSRPGGAARLGVSHRKILLMRVKLTPSFAYHVASQNGQQEFPKSPKEGPKTSEQATRPPPEYSKRLREELPYSPLWRPVCYKSQ